MEENTLSSKEALNRRRPGSAQGPQPTNPAATLSAMAYLVFGPHEHALSKRYDSLRYWDAEGLPAPSPPEVPEEETHLNRAFTDNLFNVHGIKYYLFQSKAIKTHPNEKSKLR